MERDLVLRAKAGDHDAFSALVVRSIDRCYSLASRILRDADLARDAVQNALLGAWEDIPSLREVDRFDAWLTRLVVNACYAELRHEKRRIATLRVLPIADTSVPDAAVSLANRDELDRAFRRLPPEQRAVVVLHYQGMPLVEVASTLDIPAGTARSRLHHATRQLRAAVDADARSAPVLKGRSA